MGNNTSTEKLVKPVQEPEYNEKAAYFEQAIESVAGLSITEKGGASVQTSSLSSWEHDLEADPKNRLAQNAFAKNPISAIVANTNVGLSLKNQYFFNVEVATIGSPSFFNNQSLSGRCWIFAASNVFRTEVIKKYNLPEDKFQLSQSYLFFYDKLEKANYFFENIIDTADEPLDSRLIQFLLLSPVGDGGQWDLIINLVNKYGLVPHEVFPDNAQAQSSSALNYVLTSKLREYGLVLRELVKKGKSKEEIHAVKQTFNKQIYKVVALALGTPPKPSDSFTWEYKDVHGNAKAVETNPLDFYKSHVSLDAGKYFSLVNDPRNEYAKLYTVDRLNNVYEGKPIEYVNTSSDNLKKIAIRQLKDNQPIFFGSDVAKFADLKSGVLDTTSYSYELAFGTGLNLNKAERLQTGASAMTHAMVITGVHLDKNNKPVRWKIENSWGDAVGDKGYFVMTDEWFDEYVFQIVTTKKYADKDLYEVWKAKEYVTLPFFDPLGVLA